MKLTNRKIWYMVIGLWTIVIVCMAVNNFIYNEEKIVDAFMEQDYKEITAGVEGFGQLKGSYLILEEREKLVEEVAEIFGIKEPYSITTSREQNKEITTLCKPSKNGNLNISFQVKSDEMDNLEQEPQQFLNINLELFSSIDKGLAYGELMQRTFGLYGIDGKVAVNYTGTLKGKADMKKKNAIGDELLEKMSAKVVQEYRSEDMFTIYGYTKMLDHYEIISDEKMNVNIAISFNEEEDETVVYLATPYLMEDY